MSQISAVIVDDSEVDRYIAQRALGRNDRIDQVVETTDGLDFVEFFRSARFTDMCGPHPPPTLVFLDINMPVLDGFAVLDELAKMREEDKLELKSKCIVMMLTSSSYIGDRQKADKYDLVSGYIEKPITRAKLTELIERHYCE